MSDDPNDLDLLCFFAERAMDRDGTWWGGGTYELPANNAELSEVWDAAVRRGARRWLELNPGHYAYDEVKAKYVEEAG